jgi:hypothetical protein
MLTNFAARGTPIAKSDIDAALGILNVEEASLWAVIAVETRGFGFLPDRRPKILFERHIFHRLTQGRFTPTHPDISNPRAGGYARAAGEYDRLQRASQLTETAALESASWGLGQVMGFNAKKAGFSSVEAMVTAMIAGEGAQLQAAATFIKANSPLLAAFRAGDWVKFAFYYNGSNYKSNHYDAHLSEYHILYSDAANRPELDLRTAQAALTYLGFDPKGVDGLWGSGVRIALTAYRKLRGLPSAGADRSALLDNEVLQRLKIEAQI